MKCIFFLLFAIFFIHGFSRSPTLILFDGSQGSSILLELLAQLSEVCVIGFEPLSSVQNSPSQTITRIRELLSLKWKRFEDYKSSVWSKLDSHEHFTKCTGKEEVFVLKARLGTTIVKQLLHDSSFTAMRFLLLKRNYIKQAVATLRRRDCGLGQFNLRIKVEKQESVESLKAFKERKCHIKPHSLRQLAPYYARRTENMIELLGHTPKKKYLVVHYEEMSYNMTHLMQHRVIPFLGVSSLQKHFDPPTLSKASPELLCKSIQNFQEICLDIKTYQNSEQYLKLFNADDCDMKTSIDDYSNCCTHC